jgi:hypothetical protein
MHPVGRRDRFYASRGRFSWAFFCATVFMTGCELIERPGDTTGVQERAEWAWRGRIVADTDDALTLVRLRIDTTGVTERHDVMIARYDFDPVTTSAGDEYSLTLALDLGNARALPVGTPIALDVPGGIPAIATVNCLCAPLKPDSVRGYVEIRQRGLRQLTMRVAATLWFTQWHDSTQRVPYRLRQSLFGVH